jgi:hypothetical protein
MVKKIPEKVRPFFGKNGLLIRSGGFNTHGIHLISDMHQFSRGRKVFGLLEDIGRHRILDVFRKLD